MLLNRWLGSDSLERIRGKATPMDYREIDPGRMILRDHLARDRTVLANERTLLAYVRTAIALLAAGGTLVKFFWSSVPIRILAVLLLVLGAAVVAFGGWRFRAISRRLRRLMESGGELDDDCPPDPRGGSIA